MPTRRGRVLLVSAGLAYLLARAARLDELFAPVLAAALLPLAATALVRWAQHRVVITRTVSRNHVFSGEPVRFEIAVSNPARLPSPPLLLQDRAPAALGGPVRFSLPALRPGASESASAERRSGARGRYEVGPLEALIVDPFGLASVRRELAPKTPVVVYPRVERLEGGAPASGNDGWGPTRHAGPAPAGDEFYTVRDWEDGDDLRRIHWASVARTGRLMIRQNEARPFMRATVVLDTRRRRHRGSADGSSFEWSLSAAASILWHLAGQGFMLRLATPDRRAGTPARGRTGAEGLLEALALARPAPDRPLTATLKEAAAGRGAGGILFAIVPAPAGAELAALARLRASYTWCGAVLVDADAFADVSPRNRAEADQCLADATAALTTAGWTVASAAPRDGIPTIWNELLAVRGFRPSLRSPRS